jgi:hypothetical protein
LIDFNDISYDDQAELLYNLAGQTVAHLRSYLRDAEEVLNVLQYHQQGLVNLIHAQMQEHYEEKATAYEAHVSRGFTTLRPNNYSAPADESEPDFVVETLTAQFICETKRADEMDDRDVLAKAKAASEWCGHATKHGVAHGGKPWRYLLIPHDVIADNKTLKGLAASCTDSIRMPPDVHEGARKPR